MDHAVSLVQAYLQLNGYFTSSEYPIVAASADGKKFRTVTDIDLLAFRFPTTGRALEGSLLAAGIARPDPDLATPRDQIDMIIGEVKEGRVNFNVSATEKEVLAAALDRFGCPEQDIPTLVEGLRAEGAVVTDAGYRVRLIAFGAMPPGDEVPPCRIISLGHVLQFLQTYVRDNWAMLRQCQFKDPALGFLMTLEKAKRGGAGRRGKGGVEVVPGPNENEAAAASNSEQSRRRTDFSSAHRPAPMRAKPTTPRGQKATGRK
ncbi:MAG TPA: hypothetical protein VM557_13780 [Thermoanaerobaculia bacterium]|nr:hypothetical protein [Thermoanaerobaculia bacterium]